MNHDSVSKVLSHLLRSLLVVLLAACHRPAPENRLILTGSSTIAPLVAELAKTYEAAHPGVRIDVQMGGSSRGIADVRRGTADIGMVSRDLTPSEADLKTFPIARDGVALIVHRDNPVTALTSPQVIAIYRGETRDWSRLGGPPGPIKVVNKAAGRATLKVFLDYFGLDNRDIRAAVVIGDNEQGIKTVAGDPAAIGYVSIGTAEVDIQAGVPIRLVEIDGFAPSLEAVASGRYPIGRTLHLVTKDAPRGLARDFIDAVRRAPAEVFRAFAFVPLAAG